MKRKTRSSYSEYSRSPSSSKSQSSFLSGFNYTIIAICAGIFILGIGVGIALSSGQTVNTANIASREVIDRSAPNPELCQQFGASAIVTDMRVFLTLTPFSVYLTQPRMQPGPPGKP